MMDRIGDEVRRELSRFGPEAGMAEIVQAWPAAVGEGIAAHAWPARVGRDGTLHVAASSSAWAFELSQLAGAILERLREGLGEAAPPHVRFTVGTLPERYAADDEKAIRRAPKVSPAERYAGERIAAAIGESDLRELVARAAAASLARGLDDRSV
jgi:predicted nucleic acid-binding Zn ribbon protein